ncbi:ATP-binding cassette domain-containing protein [Canibacter sp. lx-72]|uniref:ATP-binding cassette domain-containing protein n=1 Tax=Canibacter zhuwentaonis TaxID=2837491 RepID=UPI001BDD3641|nr:ATP-binding cassette domain-containing protein [Canibacter zhuwentaonis]
MEALSVRDLSFSYARNHSVIKNLSLSVPFGKITGLIGPNVSGKSTLMRVAGDLLKSQTGEIRICDAPNNTKQAKQSSILLASNDYLPEFLTGLEYLQFIHKMYGLDCNIAELERLFSRYQMEHR